MELAELPLHSATPLAWGRAVLQEPLPLLNDHAFLEKKAANNALELLTRWPNDWVPGWVETMTAVARDETAHLAQVTRLILRRGGRLERIHRNPYATALRQLVRKGTVGEPVDRLLVSAVIEVRSCERFSVLAQAARDLEPELSGFYQRLYSSELGHFTTFLKLAHKILPAARVDERWQDILAHESRILAAQEPGPRIHSGLSIE